MSYASTVLADGAVGFWELGEAVFASPAADATGNQNGVYTNTAGLTFGQTGIAGGGGATAVKFTAASSGYVSIADKAAQHVGDTFTLEMWMIRTGSGTNPRVFAGVNSAMEFQFGTGSGTVNFNKSGISTLFSSTSPVAADSAFHHVAWTKATSTNHGYIDSVDKTGAVTNAAINTAGGYRIGIYADSTSAPFDGTLQFVALYPTALTAAQILTHYRLGANLAPVNTVAPVASGSTTVGSVVSTTNGTWTDAGSPVYTYQWQRDVLGNGTYSNIAAATSSTYTLALLDDGNDVRCVVTDTDSTGLATAANSNSILDTTPATGKSGILLPLMGVG